MSSDSSVGNNEDTGAGDVPAPAPRYNIPALKEQLKAQEMKRLESPLRPYKPAPDVPPPADTLPPHPQPVSLFKQGSLFAETAPRRRSQTNSSEVHISSFSVTEEGSKGYRWVAKGTHPKRGRLYLSGIGKSISDCVKGLVEAHARGNWRKDKY